MWNECERARCPAWWIFVLLAAVLSIAQAQARPVDEEGAGGGAGKEDARWSRSVREASFVVTEESCSRRDATGGGMVLRCEIRGRVRGEEGVLAQMLLQALLPADFEVQEGSAVSHCPSGRTRRLSSLPPAPGFQAAESEGGSDPVPRGCTVELQFEARAPGLLLVGRIPLERTYPTRKFTYLWQPMNRAKARYLVSDPSGVKVQTRVEGDKVRVTGRNLPAFRSEPMMPAEEKVRALLWLYYPDLPAGEKRFWREAARELERDTGETEARLEASLRRVRRFARSSQTPGDQWLLELYELAAGRGDPASPLGVAVGELLPLLRSGVPGQQERDLAILPGPGSPMGPAHVFVAVARALGIPARLAAAIDSRVGEFRADLLSTEPFTTNLVAAGIEQGSGNGPVFLAPESGLPFGRIPWWLEGSRVLLAGRREGQIVDLPVSRPEENATEGEAHLRFTPEGSLRARWSRSYRGLSGAEWAPAVRETSRSEDLAARVACRGAPVEVTRASIESVEAGHLVLRCEGRDRDLALGDAVSVVSIPVIGPWLDNVPALPPGPRRYPLRLPYAYESRTQVEIDGPRGFLPAGTPDDVEMETPFGKYSLTFLTKGNRITIRRVLSVRAREVPALSFPPLTAFFDAIQRVESQSVAFRSELK